MLNNISIRLPSYSDEHEFIHAMEASNNFHHPWVDPPKDIESFENYIRKYESENNISYLVIHDTSIAGVININEIIRGCFQSTFLGYYVVRSFAGKGIMKKGLFLVLKKIFFEHGLHRVEANIQPNNKKSINLVDNIGFVKEGFSKNYLKINGEWQDHERWALTKENWRQINEK